MNSKEVAERNQKIKEFIEQNPQASQKDIADYFGLTRSTISVIIRQYGFDYKRKETFKHIPTGTYPFYEPCIYCEYWRRLYDGGRKQYFTENAKVRYESLFWSPCCHYNIDTNKFRSVKFVNGSCEYFKEREEFKPREHKRVFIDYKKQRAERNANIIERYKNGETQSEIARSYGISYQMVHKIVKGVKPNESNR